MATKEQIKQLVTEAISTTPCRNEKEVKQQVRRVVTMMGGCVFMPPANGYGKAGVSDFIGVRNGVAIAIETKFGRNKATPAQMQFGEQWLANGGLFYLINEKNMVRELSRMIEETQND